MAIRFDEKNKVFHLSTPSTSYIFGLYRDRFLIHLYYGKKVESDFDIDDIYLYQHKGFSTTSWLDDGIMYSEEVFQMEYPCFGSVDLRTPAFHARYKDGSTVTKLEYNGYKITKGKPKLLGLPAAYVEDDSEADTLEVELCDKKTGLKVILMYNVYNNLDIITRSVKAVNTGSDDVEILKIMSMSIDMFDSNYDFVHLQGKWAYERHIQKTPLFNGMQKIESMRGHSSHQHNPFFALARHNTTETEGSVYGFGFVYSGNFTAGVEVNAECTSRAFMGINDFNFRWILKENEEFQAPEVVMTYSDSGYNKMSQNFHTLVRTRICRGKYRDSERPVLINNWEGTYFNFTEDKIVEIAKTAKEVGVELMVLDDGWFGHRDAENSSLGDWYPYKKKLPNGISGLSKKINELGMKFGLWFEPEMASPDSDLYRKHPEWILQVEGREPSQGRNQYVLDLSRDDVCEYILGIMRENLRGNPITYVKWDMNRSMSEVGSLKLPPEQQQEVAHRYILGLYRIYETLNREFPDVLFEGCSGGGGRFDMGMLYYNPQIWTSDNNDACERMYIQYGTSMLYPSSVMCAHFANAWRNTPLHTRGNVAFLGRFGYELDITKLTEDEKKEVSEEIKFYKKWGEVIHHSTMYRLMSPFDTNYMSMEFVSEDKKYVIIFFGSILGQFPQPKFERIYPEGLDKGAKYKNLESGKIIGGDVLSNIGIMLHNDGDFESKIMIFERQ